MLPDNDLFFFVLRECLFMRSEETCIYEFIRQCGANTISRLGVESQNVQTCAIVYMRLFPAIQTHAEYRHQQ